MRDERGGLDILINNQVGWEDTPSPDGFKRRRLWERPASWWDGNFDAGVRGHVVNCHYGVPLMLDRKGAIVLFTSEMAAADPSQAWDAVFDLRASVAARMVSLLSHQLRPHTVAAVLLYPGWTRTEGQIDTIEAGECPAVETMDEYLQKTVSPHYTGRAAAALAADADALELSGSIQSSYQLANRYGFTDVDGRRPDPS